MAVKPLEFAIFSARQHIAYSCTCLARCMLSSVRPSACPHVRHTGGSIKNG